MLANAFRRCWNASMEIEFGDKHLAARYASYREAVRAWGKDVADAYIRRVNFLADARNVHFIRASRGLRLHALKGAHAGQLAIDLAGRWRLIITISGDTVRIEEVSNHCGD